MNKNTFLVGMATGMAVLGFVSWATKARTNKVADKANTAADAADVVETAAQDLASHVAQAANDISAETAAE